jgi:hypothetical protein
MALGLGRVAMEETQVRMRRHSFTLIIVGTLLVTIPLGLSGYRAVSNTLALNKTTEVVQDWLQGSEPDRIAAVDVDGKLVSVSIEGAAALRSVEDLATRLEKTLGHPVVVTLYRIPVQVDVARSRPSP